MFGFALPPAWGILNTPADYSQPLKTKIYPIFKPSTNPVYFKIYQYGQTLIPSICNGKG
jgi:hypothetical protein